MSKKKFAVAPFVGISSVWFGTHMGPGVASGKQVSSYFAEAGKLGIFAPIIGMTFLGIAIYFAIEYSRRNNIHDFHTFSSKFFHPHEKLFNLFFEIAFIVTCILVPGLCIITSASLLHQYFGLDLWIGSMLIATIGVLLAIYGANLVKNASAALTVGIIAIVGIIIALGINHSSVTIQKNWAQTPVTDISIWSAIASSFVYAGFQATGNITNAIAVSEGLNNKRDSFKAAVLGILLNTLVLMFLALTQFGFQPASYASELPNHYVVLQLGIPALETAYVVLVLLASISTLLAFAFAASSRYGKYVQIKSKTGRNLVITIGMLIINIVVSTLGISAIVNVGFRYLGYLALPLVLIPVVIVGFKKVYLADKTIPSGIVKKA